MHFRHFIKHKNVRELSLPFTLIVFYASARAQAPQCSFNMSTISFGTIDVTNGRPYDATGTFSYACTGDAREIVRLCPSLGVPKDGPRFLTDKAGHKLFFKLYTDEARTNVWGSWFSSVKGPSIEVPLGRSEKSTGSENIYGRIEPGQKDAPAGVYNSSISGGNSITMYAYAKDGGCNGFVKEPYAHPSLTITARVNRGGDLVRPMVAPDATHPNASGGSSSVQGGSQADRPQKGLLQKLMDNAAYQQQRQNDAPHERDSDSKSSKSKDQQSNRAAYLESHSCMTTMGAEKAGQLSDDCTKTTSAPHSACNIQQNTCNEIRDATKRGCDGLGSQAPDFCFVRYR